MLTRTPIRKHDRPRRRPGVVKISFYPLRDPTSAASATQNSNARIPPCEDGVDPFATTAGAANDDTTADEEDG